MKTEKLINTKLYLKGGVLMDSVIAVLKEFDRLENNLYFPSKDFIEKVLDAYGYITFMMFVCPKMKSKYLTTNDKERFMPIEEPKDGLVFPRLPKLQEITTKLWKLGVPSKIIFVVGDNGFEVYKGPPICIFLDKKKVDERRQKYLQNLSAQLARVFPQLMEVESLGLMQIETYRGELELPVEMFDREVAFQCWSFQKYYEGNVPNVEALRKIAELKIRAYAEQGSIIEAADAILISTEGTDLNSWVQRTQMFQVAGANFPSIYPYIRKESNK